VSTRSGLARRLGCCDVPLALVVLLVALAESPAFVDRYVSVKWYVLEVTAAAWLLGERLACGGRGLPSFVRRTWIAWTALLAWILVGSLRSGLGWAVAPLVARAAFLALALASYWCFRRTGPRLEALRVSVAGAAAIVVGLGLAQFAGLPTLPGLGGGDRLSATFGNVNMAAQFLGLALVVLLSAPVPHPRDRGGPTEFLGGCIVAYVVVAGARSVALALVASLSVLAVARRLPAARLARMLATAAVVVVVLQASPTARGLLQPQTQVSKSASARWRLDVWADTLDLVRDHPLGVGAGNFEHAFVSYALAGRSRPGEDLVFRSPHDDYLRLVAEEGVAAAAVLLAVVLLLLRELARTVGLRSHVGALLASCAAFLAVEASLQFPFEMAFPALLAAVLLGLAFAANEGAPPPVRAETRAGRAAWPASVLAVSLAVALLAGVVRIATAEALFASHRDQLPCLERACRLDPRRLDACVEAAWHHSREGRHEAAQRALAEVLRRSPAYLPARKLRAEDLLIAGQTRIGCAAAREYDATLDGRSSLHALVVARCDAVRGSPSGAP
jgi:O-antigen ligase